MPINLTTIIGARPQFIKAASVSRALKSRSPEIKESIIHTGQHYDKEMSDVFFEEMKIPKPDHFLGIGGLSQGSMTGRMIESIESIFLKAKPDWILVYGDTNTTLAASLAAVKLHIPIAHVEAGLRSFNKKMPEEVNRVLTDHLSSLLFTPTSKGKENLLREGVSPKKIIECGDVMADSVFFYAKQAEEKIHLLKELDLSPRNYVLTTLHRQENTDQSDRFREILEGLFLASKERRIVWPLHPRTEKILKNENLYEKASRLLTLLPPLGYLDMLFLQKNALVIATDSGGVQKEAYLLKVPCLTLREETEWVELLEKGYNRLVPLSREAIFECLTTKNESSIEWESSLYGDGKASETIVKNLIQFSKLE
ncbi:UDP-N-acetylglucosamine 2-epimerase [Criblamydia sequanensis CRIB-18]|uniref:UDP-N-acetylglucosamine 2-epimerase n=1 Tax=Candidatus Criblamydia sequanensis CRIB-18 TaxID=1437425 RepID=A0A090D261_9BACT|nr:UDP-N-acetylglucosamine 2-epimerase (non-hydrolyzing) [Criblamydia sequanensis]CDR34350.1 UDP-N-acetylglucosamine 2-epimerase [Criblamydia sequanensis CRIB-18]